MGNDNDRSHFEDYRRQTQVKHEILSDYLKAYFHILKTGNHNMLFVDGFAGRGTYTRSDTGETAEGSPIRALKLIAETKDFAAKVSTIFIEADDVLYQHLDETVRAYHRKYPHIREPLCMHGRFGDRIREVIKAVEGHLAPTFLFVDPCGVSGTSFEAIRDVMRCDKCEAFIFFNIDGVRRIAGLAELSDILVELMGSRERAQLVYDELRTTCDAVKREHLILSHYRKAIRERMGADFVIAFRVECEDKQKTSHYLIHATKHPLGFRIMKDIMWRRGQAEDQDGGLEFAQASRTNYVPLFDLRGDAVKQAILGQLAKVPARVSLFCEDWVCRPDDMLCEAAYKKALLELEEAGKIDVYGKDGANPAPAVARPKRKGKPTLANEYHVRIAVRAPDQ